MSKAIRTLTYCPILGVNINVTDMDACVDYLSSELNNLRGQYICVANVHTTVTAYRDENYRHIQNAAAMSLPDGKPLSLTSRRRGFPEARRVAGPDLMPAIFALSKEAGYKHYFYGSSEETLEKLRQKLKQEWPYLNIVGMYSPPFAPMSAAEDDEIVARINAAKPDFIWVALGAPKQEAWMHAHSGQLCGLMIGVGAAFDFLAGTIRRAPRLLQGMYLEWLYRLLKDPIRLTPRYLKTNFSYIFRAGVETKAQNKQNRHKKIAMIGHKRIPSREGGVEIVVDELSTRLVQKGYHVVAYNRKERTARHKRARMPAKTAKSHNGIRIINIPTFRSNKLNAVVYAALATLRALFGGHGVIHYHAEGPSMMLGIPRIFGIRVISTIHGLDWQRAKWGTFASKMLKHGEKTAAKKADELIVLSGNMKEYFLTTYGRDVHFIPNGINRAITQKAQAISEKHGLEKDGYILFLARLVPEKGLHYLIEAYKLMPDGGGKKLVIAGSNNRGDDYTKQIRRMVSGNKNIIMTGFVQGQLLAELFSNAYVYVLPSDVEGMAISLLEAMSYGNCCLISDIAENTEVVEQAALHFKRGDARDLADKLWMLAEHPALVEKYQREAADFICKKYSWDEVVEQTVALYENTHHQ